MKKINEEKELKKVNKTKKKITKNKKVVEKVEVAQAEKRVASFSLIEMILVVVIVSLVVSVLSGYLVFKNYDFISNQTSNKETNNELKEFIDLYNELKEKYVEDIESDKIIDAAIDGMLNYLDVYTDYLDETTTNDLQERLNGEYQGIGVEITNNSEGNVEIVTIFKDTPAEKAGLEVGDVFVEINGENMLGKTSSDVANTIKGGIVDEVKIKYQRAGEIKEATINVENVTIPSAEYEMFDGKQGYLNITTFSSTTYAQTKKALKYFEKEGATSLIIDVRNNSGGYLSSAQSIADLFLEKGKTIYNLKYKDGILKSYDAKTDDKTTYPIVVLINEASASASEILAAALRDSYGAKLVGTKSFGKGTVQETEVLSNGAMVKYTSAYWLTPKGAEVNKIGLTPDIIINNTEEEDLQLNSAKEALK